jgi:hypothetical protein
MRCLAQLAPRVLFFSKPSESYFQVGSQWRRATPEDEARFHTGFALGTGEPSVGVYLVPRPNGLTRIGFDLWRLGTNFRRDVVEQLQARWNRESAHLSRSLLRSASRRSHFAPSFVRCEIQPDRVEGWKCEIEAILSDLSSFEPPPHPANKETKQ